MSRRTEAPLYVDSLRVAQWIVENVPAHTPLGARIQVHAIDLCEHVALALGRARPDDALSDADDTLVKLRVALRLMLDAGLLPERGFLHLARELDPIGRQLGGWLRRISRGDA